MIEAFQNAKLLDEEFGRKSKGLSQAFKLDEIAAIVMHATGTKMGDEFETNALVQTLGDRLSKVPITALKGHLGHHIYGSVPVEAVLSIEALRQGIIPSVYGLSGVESIHSDLRDTIGRSLVIGQPQKIPEGKKYISQHGVGFGGTACNIIWKKRDD